VFREGSMPSSSFGKGKKVKTWQEVKEEAKALFLEKKWAETGPSRTKQQQSTRGEQLWRSFRVRWLKWALRPGI